MRRAACLALMLLVVASVASASPQAKKPTPAQMRAKIKKQSALITRLQASLADARASLADARNAQADQASVIADQRGVIADRNATITDRNEQIKALQARDPLDAILARDADGKWAAMLALWRAFPSLPSGVFCGYNKTTDVLGSLGLSATTYTFYLWSGC